MFLGLRRANTIDLDRKFAVLTEYSWVEDFLFGVFVHVRVCHIFWVKGRRYTAPFKRRLDATTHRQIFPYLQASLTSKLLRIYEYIHTLRFLKLDT